MKKYKLLYICILTLLLTLGLLSQFALANSVRSANTELELVSEYPHVLPGQSFWVALRMKMDDHWHTYWRNSGDSGIPVMIKWELPDSLRSREIHWPYPTKMDEAGITTYAFEGEIFLLVQMDPQRSLNLGETLNIKAHVEFLACERVCLPGKADLELNLLVSGSRSPASNPYVIKFKEARSKLPLDSNEWLVAADESAKQIRFRITPSEFRQYSITGMEFFPYEKKLINHAADQLFTKTRTGYELIIEKSHLVEGAMSHIQGVIVSNEGWRGVNSERSLYVDVDFGQVSQDYFKRSSPAIDIKLDQSMSIGLALLFAFLGGLILNLMPCVLPILSIKILSLIEHKDDKTQAWKNGLAFTAGVVVSFWVLAGLLIIFKMAGEQIGWGFQFQSPGFLISITAILFLIGLNLFGMFEIGASLLAVEGHLKGKSKVNGAFMSGVLATIVATPCTAPFMGTALAFAISQTAIVALLIFTFLGLGMAAPFLVIARFPQMLRFLPKPGKWMIYLKRGLGLLMMATVVWLLWVYSLQLGTKALFAQIGGLFIIMIGAFIYGRWASVNQESSVRTKARIAAALIVGLGLIISVIGVQLKETIKPVQTVSQGKIKWQEYSPELVQKLRDEGKPIFIDFTAAWCLSCQVNERVVFSDRTVIRTFKEYNIEAIKADWTNKDEEITQALISYGKWSIPVYVIYSPDSSKEPVILPEIITPGIVLKALKDINN